MAHFRGTLSGNRGEASRLGTKSSGLMSTCRGWNLGADCVLQHDDHEDQDVLTVNVGRGSGHRNGGFCFGVNEKDLDKITGVELLNGSSYKEMLNAVLTHQEVLPLLIGMHPDLDKKIEELMKQ